MVIPIRDDNPTTRKPVLTVAIIAACIFIYAFVQPHQSDREVEFLAQHAAIPCEVVHHQPISNTLSRQCDGQLEIPGLPGSVEPFPHKNVFLAIIVSMFLHGSWFHVLGNMLFLWAFGKSLEDAMGHGKFLAFYLSCGVIAAVVQMAGAVTNVNPLLARNAVQFAAKSESFEQLTRDEKKLLTKFVQLVRDMK